MRQLTSDGIIGLDPCANELSMVDARRAYFEVDNGLVQSWRGHGLVFMNPPHSTSPCNIEPWMEKYFKEFANGPWDSKDQFVGLVPSKTDTLWFHDHAREAADAMCFIRGRIKFWQAGVEMPGPGRFASLVLYTGHNVSRFKALFGPLGMLA